MLKQLSKANLGKLVKTIRHERGLNQRQVAEALGVSTPTVCRMEAGQYSPDIDDLWKWICWLFPEMEQGKAEQSAE